MRSSIGYVKFLLEAEISLLGSETHPKGRDRGINYHPWVNGGEPTAPFISHQSLLLPVSEARCAGPSGAGHQRGQGRGPGSSLLVGWGRVDSQGEQGGPAPVSPPCHT